MFETADRFEAGFHILNQWLAIKQKGKNLASFFEDNDIGNAAIYGMGALGERLLCDLRQLQIPVLYGIDKMAEEKRIQGLKLYGADTDFYPDVDAIIVTPVQDYWNIVEALKNKTKVPILSLEDVIEYCA